LRACAKFSTNFEEILLHAHGNFEECSKVLEISIIIINYCIIIIIDAHYSSVINAYCHYYTSNKSLMEECDIKKKFGST
jgi:hypothetical protein